MLTDHARLEETVIWLIVGRGVVTPYFMKVPPYIT